MYPAHQQLAEMVVLVITMVIHISVTVNEDILVKIVKFLYNLFL